MNTQPEELYCIHAECRYCDNTAYGTHKDLQRDGWVFESFEGGFEMGQCPECAIAMSRGD